MSLFFYLNEDHSVRICSVDEWSEQIEYMMRYDKKRIKEDRVNGKHISTVWLGINHNYSEGIPLIFETMVFNDGNFSEEYCDRYSTYDKAIEGHKKAVNWVLDGCKHE